MFDINEFKKKAILIQQSDQNRANSLELKGEKLLIPVRDGVIDVYLYKAKRDGIAPVLFDIHGGGFVFGHASAQDMYCDMIRNDINIHVVSVNYRLAPQFTFPAAPDDVYDAIEYFSEHAETYGIDRNSMAVSGHSAGANLATAVAMKAARSGEFTLRCQVLDYPFLDMVSNPFDKPAYKGTTPPFMCAAFIELYAPNQNLSDPFLSPVYATVNELKGLPPTAVFTAELDSLCPEGERYASMLVQVGVPVYCRRFLGAVHGFVEVGLDKSMLEKLPAEMVANYPPDLSEKAYEALAEIETFVGRYLQANR